MVQEIERFAQNVFGAPRYKEVERRLNALAQEMKEESLITESVGEDGRFQEEAFHHRFFDYYPDDARLIMGENICLLTPIENQIMHLFTANPNKFLSTTELVNLVWGDEYSVGNLKTYIYRVRKKLSMTGQEHCIIESANSKGYRLLDPDRDSLSSGKGSGSASVE